MKPGDINYRELMGRRFKPDYTTGDIVKYANPEKGEENFRFRCLSDPLETNAISIRLMDVGPDVGFCKGWRIMPISVVPAHELVKSEEVL